MRANQARRARPPLFKAMDALCCPEACPAVPAGNRAARWLGLGLIRSSSCTIFPSLLCPLLSPSLPLSASPYVCAHGPSWAHSTNVEVRVSLKCRPHLRACLRQGLLFTDAYAKLACPTNFQGFSCFLPSCSKRARAIDAHCHFCFIWGLGIWSSCLCGNHFSFNTEISLVL